MAILRSRVLFFTTSPRSPQKMIPEISLLHQHFSGKKWNNESQIEFINRLSESDFFEGRGSPTDKAFSARDRINRAPKALGFINLNPTIELTQAGKEFIFGKRYQEVFLRQLLKFQLPSPYHVEDSIINGSFRVRPYLEVIRLIRTLGYLSFNEVKIFALQLTDYRNFDVVKQKIENFRFMLKLSKGDKSKYINNVWNSEISTIYSDEINTGQTQTRQSRDTSIKKFLATKRSNQRDYADACFRYLRMSGIISISHRGHSVFIDESKYKEVDFILSNVDREPIYIDEIDSFKKYLFDPTIPSLFTDNKANLVNQIMKLSSYTRQDLVDRKSVV